MAEKQFALGTFSVAGSAPFAGLVVDNQVIALTALQPFCRALGAPLTNTSSTLALLEDWECNFASLQRAIAAIVAGEQGTDALQAQFSPIAHLKTHAPVTPRQVLCSGANYFKHVVDLIVDQGAGATPETEGLNAEELRAAAERLMTERATNGTPYAFIKAVSAVTGPFDTIELPYDASQPDWELELAVVIGRRARRVSRADAMNYVAGYTIANDLSNRDLLYRPDVKGLGTDWVSCKSAPGYLPLGPYIVPAAFVPNPHDLQLTLKLNGQVMQDESSADMIFDIARQIEYISSRIELLPGDIICTGSPSGNGTHYNRFLRDGDVIESTISGLGMQRNRFIAEKQPEAGQ